MFNQGLFSNTCLEIISKKESRPSASFQEALKHFNSDNLLNLKIKLERHTLLKCTESASGKFTRFTPLKFASPCFSTSKNALKHKVLI